MADEKMSEEEIAELEGIAHPDPHHSKAAAAWAAKLAKACREIRRSWAAEARVCKELGDIVRDGWVDGLKPHRPIDYVKRLEVENTALREERDSYRAANESVRVCAAHTQEITQEGECLICEADALRERVEELERLVKHWRGMAADANEELASWRAQ